jgi:hypothetical protein
VTRRRLLLVVLVLVVLAVPAAWLGLQLFDDDDAGPIGGLSGEMRTALDELPPDELPTLEIANQPGWLHRTDDASSKYQAVWAFATSPSTPYRAPDGSGQVSRYLLLDPREQDDAGNVGHDEWWFVIERYWPSSYPASNHGHWGRHVNFHNVAGDAGAEENGNAGVGWGFGSGVSALALDWLPADSSPSLCVLCAYQSEGGAQHPLPVPTRDEWHTYVVHWIAGRTDGTTVRPGLVEVWVDGADEPHLRLTNVNTVQKAIGDRDGKPYVQKWMVLWEGDYTSELPVEARQRLVLTRIGRTLEEAIDDRPTLVGTTLGGYYRGSGDAPKPSITVLSPGRKASAAGIPESLAEEADGTVG